MVIIYVDILFLVNSFLNLWGLWATARLAGVRQMPAALLQGSLIGTAYLFLSLLSSKGWLLHPLIKPAVACLMVWVAFRPRQIRALPRLLACFLVLSFLTAGTVLGAYSFVLKQTSHSPVLLWGDMPSGVILLGLLLLWGPGRVLFAAWENRLTYTCNEAQILAYIGDTVLELSAFVDSGNRLTEPGNGRPVIVVLLQAVWQLLPPDICRLCRQDGPWEERVGELADCAWADRLHFIPYSSVAAQEGLLLAIRSDYVRIRYTDSVREDSGILLALSPAAAQESFAALLPARLLPAV